MISVVIPTLDEERALPSTLDAVLSQPGELEVCVVDGGSVDRTRQIVEETSARDRRLRLLTDQEDASLAQPHSGRTSSRDQTSAAVSRIHRTRVMDLVLAYFRALPARQREVFDLVDLQGYSPAEVATMLDLNPATVRASLFKARRTVRRKIFERHPELA